MESVDIIAVWKQSKDAETASPRYSLEQIQAYRRKSTNDSRRSGKLSIQFDLIYKAVVALGFGFLLSLPLPAVFQWVAGASLGLMLTLISWQLSFLKRLRAIKPTDAVADHLKNQLHFLQKTYRQFVFTGAATNPLFVLAGFMLYAHYKHEPTDIDGFFQDPVLYGFVILAYAFALGAQWPYYQKHMKEVREMLESVDDDVLATLQLHEQRKKRLKRMITFAILFFIGLMILLILLL